MKWMWCSGVVLAASVALGAQGGSGGGTGQGSGTGQGAGSGQGTSARAGTSGAVTITGCLQADKNKSVFWLSDAAAGAKGAAGTTGSGTAAKGEAAKGEAPKTGTSGTPSATSGGSESVQQMKSTAAAETYQLNPGSGVSLQGHVGHKVEISGTVATGARAGSAAPAASAETRHLQNAKQIEVTAVKHISEVCEPGKQ